MRDQSPMKTTAIGAFVVISTLAATAQAEPVIRETKPIDGDIFRDYRISGCEETKAMAAFRYQTAQGDVLALSDICLDEEEGEIVAIEDASGLTLVEKTNDARAYEILSSGSDRYSRVRIAFDPDEEAPGCGADQDVFHSIHYDIPNKAYISANKDAFAVAGKGSSVEARSATPQKTTASGVYLGLRPLSIDGGPIKVHANIYADAYGDFAMKGEVGNITLNKGDDNWVGEADGTLRVSVDEHGYVFMGGGFSYKSRRLAGHHADEWVTMKGTIPYARGHFLGEDGVLLKAYGLAKGTYVDASGREHSFRSLAYVIGCFSWQSSSPD